MKLLLDQNLSPRLIGRLNDLYPESSHVYMVGLDQSSDEEVWAYARKHDFTIVTKDVDFTELSQTQGFPPNVIWLRLGNCTTNQIEEVLRSRQKAIYALENDPEAGVLTLL